MAGVTKSATTPDHKTTLYTMGLSKGFHSPHRKPPGKRPNTTADQPHEQCGHPPPPRLRAKWSKRELPRVSKPDRKTVVPNLLSKVRYLLESQSNPLFPQEPLQCPTQPRDTAGTAKPPSAHDQTTDQAGTHQAMTYRCLLDPVKPNYNTSRHDLKSAPLAGWEISLP